jgi:hypothetical protein
VATIGVPASRALAHAVALLWVRINDANPFAGRLGRHGGMN